MSKPIEGQSRSVNNMLKMAIGPEAEGNIARLGADAMLLDASPALTGLAQGAAVPVGPAKDKIVNTLLARDAGTAERLQAAREAALGKRVIPSQVEASLADARKALGPEYEAALSQAQAVAKNVRSMLDIPTNPGTLDPSPRALLEARKAIDGLRKGELDSNVQRILGESRAAIDAELAARVPGIKDVDAKYAELAEKSQALKRGQEVFDTARPSFIRPEQMKGEMAKAPDHIRQGMNAGVDRLISTRSDDLMALETLAKKPANAEKLREGFGSDKADPLIDAIMQNRKYRDSYNAIDRGSQTAQRLEAANMVDSAGVALPESGGVGGLGIRAVNEALSYLTGRSSENTRQAIADLATRKGADAEEVIRAILAAKVKAKSVGDAIVYSIAHGRAVAAAAYENRPRH